MTIKKLQLSRHLAALLPGLVLGVFFHLSQLTVFNVVLTMLAAYLIAVIYGQCLAMPKSWLHVLAVNTTLSVLLAIISLSQDLTKTFALDANMLTVFLLACGLMFVFLVLFALTTWLYWLLDRWLNT